MRVVDLFSGCGGLSLGFELAGFEVVGAFDAWKAAGETYQQNFSHPFYLTDVAAPQTRDAIRALNPEVIVGGPPCQDFSSAGKRNEDGGRGDLSVTFAEIVAEIQPRYFVMENVERITRTRKLVEIQTLLTQAGYRLHPVILDASLCGVPQKRKRFFLFGAQDLDSMRLQSLINSRLAQRPLTVRAYMGNELALDYYYRHPRSYARRAVFSVDEPSPTVRGVNRPVPGGYPGHVGDAAPLSSALRPLTFAERARIQTFPPHFIFVGNAAAKEQMLGNAVPVNLARFVAETLILYRAPVSPRLPQAFALAPFVASHI